MSKVKFMDVPGNAFFVGPYDDKIRQKYPDGKYDEDWPLANYIDLETGGRGSCGPWAMVEVVESATLSTKEESPKYPNWQSMDRQNQNAILKQHGYKWTKFTREWLEDNDDFETTPGWHLFSPDDRDVDVAQAFDEINRGREVVLSEIQAQEQADKLERQRRRQVKASIATIAAHIREHGEKPESGEFPVGETLLDSRNIYGSGEAFVIEPDNTIWHLIKNGMDGDNWSRNNLPGHIAYRLPANEIIATNLRQLVASLKGE